MLRDGGPKCGLLRAFLDAWCGLTRAASWSRRIRASSLPLASRAAVLGFLGTPETAHLSRTRREFRPVRWHAGPTKVPRPGGAALRLRRASARHADNSSCRRISLTTGLRLRGKWRVPCAPLRRGLWPRRGGTRRSAAFRRVDDVAPNARLLAGLSW